MRTAWWAMGLAALIGGGLAVADSGLTQPAPPAIAMPERGTLGAVDYSAPSAWLCRPGVDDGSCSTNLDAIAIDAAGTRTPAPYAPAADPKIDCFYVYPTVSQDPTMYSDMNAGPEERRTVHAQAARLGSVCRVFAPIYHQLTNAALHWAMAQPQLNVDFNPSYADVLAAWRSYMKRDNKGRGVVLIGHSQGAILLKRLIAEEIDGKPVEKKSLVAAYLAGNLDVASDSFKSIPRCVSSSQTGCLVAWSSFPESYEGPRFFGGAGTTGRPVCVNPAALTGGRGMLKAYFSKPGMASAGDPPYVEAVGQLSAQCVTDDKGAVLRVRVEPGAYAGLLNAALAAGSPSPSWGLHPLDVNLVLGNVVELITSQGQAWGLAHR